MKLVVTFIPFFILFLIIARKVNQLRSLRKWYDGFVEFYELGDGFKIEKVTKLTAETLLFGRPPELPYAGWFEYGVAKDWITPTCMTHQGVAITAYEYALLQETKVQWICDIVDRMKNSVDEDEDEVDGLPHIYVARIHGPNGELLLTGMEDLDTQKMWDQLREQLGD
jgi:hypothetical protein